MTQENKLNLLNNNVENKKNKNEKSEISENTDDSIYLSINESNYIQLCRKANIKHP